MGEAAGAATCISLASGVAPRDIDVRALQAELIRTGGNLGQALRAIPGIRLDAAAYEELYPNPEFCEVAVTVKDAVNEFTKK